MTKRKLEDLNLLDDFLFNSVVNYPDIGEKFIRELLRVILGKDFGKLTVIPQKFYPGSDTDKHGARLDVYIEENDTSKSENDIKVYDVEPDKNINDVNILPQRVRFYHAKIDAHCLKSGESYQKNAENDNLRIIQQMVNIVKHDKGVSLEYMKIIEREEMLIQQGRQEERVNTERERQRAEQEKNRANQEKERADQEKERADQEKERADYLEEELRRLKEQLNQ